MNSAFKSRQLSFLVQNIIFTLVLFGLHSYLLSYLATDISFFFPVWQIYVFHFVITTLLYTVINYKYSSGKTEVFNVFMMSTFLKMILAIVFLLPLLLSDKENRQPDVFNFFIPYFLYLFFEVFSLTKFLQKTP
ncbi:hypothetical protein [Meridianimaribacter flavus]|uniref:Polysaccharide biosynthesis protein n=1 Tax=Meridianimaribacter flavus TaxID=571115 RepID=A0ABY2G930_9FLAO|nr:hypothetical protein [Meridianimaribacter flavus]TDY13616.1 hypothetical protein A8975_0209 [Meridianimaribacter flavus]